LSLAPQKQTEMEKDVQKKIHDLKNSIFQDEIAGFHSKVFHARLKWEEKTLRFIEKIKQAKGRNLYPHL